MEVKGVVVNFMKCGKVRRFDILWKAWISCILTYVIRLNDLAMLLPCEKNESGEKAEDNRDSKTQSYDSASAEVVM